MNQISRWPKDHVIKKIMKGQMINSKYKTDKWTLRSEFEKFSAKDSYFILQLIFKKLLLVECCSSIKKRKSQLFKKAVILPFINYLSGMGLHVLQPNNIIQQSTSRGRSNMRMHLCSLLSLSQKIVKKQWHYTSY